MEGCKVQLRVYSSGSKTLDDRVVPIIKYFIDFTFLRLFYNVTKAAQERWARWPDEPTGCRLYPFRTLRLESQYRKQPPVSSREPSRVVDTKLRHTDPAMRSVALQNELLLPRRLWAQLVQLKKVTANDDRHSTPYQSMY